MHCTWPLISAKISAPVVWVHLSTHLCFALTWGLKLSFLGKQWQACLRHDTARPPELHSNGTEGLKGVGAISLLEFWSVYDQRPTKMCITVPHPPILLLSMSTILQKCCYSFFTEPQVKKQRTSGERCIMLGCAYGCKNVSCISLFWFIFVNMLFCWVACLVRL